MKTSEIRNRWLKYFEGKNHLVVPSSSLISPDPSTLYTIAGMVPFIPYFTGLQTPPSKRITSVQKCVRTLDIDEVGKTTRHGTFFQMNGNFSFGDYFKEDAIRFAWELVTGSKEKGNYGFDKELVWVTVHENDDEAFSLWKEIAGLPDERIQRRDNKDNFWHTGLPGPGGECSEIYIDRGPEYGKEGGPIADEDRYLEIWNLVFQHYLIDNVKSKEVFDIVGELDTKNIDTGMGLERVAILLQGKDNFYEIDEVYPVIEKMSKLSNREYGKDKLDDIQFRVIADHIRSSLMIISDGVKPSNEGRGYVLRRLLRRSIRAAKLLGYDQPVIEELFNVSRDAMSLSYPEVANDYQRIIGIALNEEEAFRKTLVGGMKYFNIALDNLRLPRVARNDGRTGAGPNVGATQSEIATNQGSRNDDGRAGAGAGVLDGETVFKLHDTHGFPFEITKEMAEEKGLSIDEGKFRELMQVQKERAKQDSRAKKGSDENHQSYNEIQKTLTEPNKFVGYKDLEAELEILGIVTNSGPATVTTDEEIELVLGDTPFYFESGGQQADHGTLTGSSGAILEVIDVQSPIKGLIVHKCKLLSGTITLGETVKATVDPYRRKSIAKAHSATHMIHKALRELLGDSSHQAGSLDAPNRLRFDIHNPEKISDETIQKAEKRVNELLIENLEVEDELMPIDKAREAGAMALFGEKYGDIVRVVSIGDDWSKELCVGTHVKSSGELGSVTIVSESSVGSGIRRVDALVGESSFDYNNKERVLLNQISNLVGAPKDILIPKIESIISQLNNAEKAVADIKKTNLMSNIDEVVGGAKAVNGVKVASVKLENIDDKNIVKDYANKVISKLSAGQGGVFILFNVDTGAKKTVIQIFSNSSIDASELAKKVIPLVDGKGGGQAKFANVATSKTDDETLQLVKQTITDAI
jgi:alanyl-tRNA synthetase